MSVAACGGSDGGDDKNGGLLNKVVDERQQLTSSEDMLKICSAEDMPQTRSKKRGISPYYIGRRKSYKKLQTDLGMKKSKETAKEEQVLNKKLRRKQIERERRRTSHSDHHSMGEKVDGDEINFVKDDHDPGEMADDSM